MASSFENKERRIIPNFRKLEKTIQLGEVDDFCNVKPNIPNISVDSAIRDWRNNRTVVHAGELTGVAILNGLTSLQDVKEAADFILQNETKATRSQISLAKYLLNTERTKTEEKTELEKYIDENKHHRVTIEISATKKLLIKYPYNPFSYSELSRLYAVIGNGGRALHYMRIAYNLAPSNRYILRSYARLLLHFGKMEEAHDLIKKSTLIRVDPWIVATEISISSLLDKTTNLLKRGIDFVNSNNFNQRSLTELAGSIATVELFNGTRKKKSRIFCKIVKKPK